MKALIVADNNLVIDNISTVLKSAGYDVIVYKWLLKALDNVEEIGPHLIVISTQEYPRHWKTLTQFSQTNFGDYTPQVILYTGSDFDEEEQKKAVALGVRGFFGSVDVEGLDQLREILKTKIDIYSGTLFEPKDPATVQNTKIEIETQTDNSASEESEPEIEEENETVNETVENKIEIEEPVVDTEPEAETEIEEEIPVSISVDDILKDNVQYEEPEAPSFEDAEAEQSTLSEDIEQIPCSFIFTNPDTGALISGYAFNYNGETLEYNVDFPDSIVTLEKGTIINFATIKTENKISPVKAQILNFTDTGILFEIKQAS